MILYRTPGRSFTRPPRTSTIECSCRLWPMPGMYAVTSIPDVRRTRATFRSAELGFLGVWVNTRVQTPRRWGDPFNAGVFDFSGFVSRPLRTSCWIVGTRLLRAWIHGANCGRPGCHRTGDTTREGPPEEDSGSIATFATRHLIPTGLTAHVFSSPPRHPARRRSRSRGGR